jgi:hypothetical protein
MVEKVSYQIIKKINSIEIRKYPKLILAYVEGYSDNTAFNMLFQFISGNNKFQEKIKMTAPVINSKRIEMTSPVLSKEKFMAFILPSIYEENSVPIPLDSNIKIKVEAKKKLAVIRFSGYTTTKKIKKFEDKLFSELHHYGYKTKGEPLLMRYNSPFTPPFIRRNELGVEVFHEEIEN